MVQVLGRTNRQTKYLKQTSPLLLLSFGDVDLLTKRFTLGASLNTTFSCEGRLLHLSATAGNQHALRQLLEHDMLVVRPTRHLNRNSPSLYTLRCFAGQGCSTSICN